MYDEIVQINKSVIQHGKMNDRIYLISLSVEDYGNIIEVIDKIQEENNYSKIFLKIPEKLKDKFLDNGYIIEAEVPNYYLDKGKCIFASKFVNPNRKNIANEHEVIDILQVAEGKKNAYWNKEINNDVSIRKLDVNDISDMIDIYQEVFDTYPFPIHNPLYIQETMNNDVVYYGLFISDRLIGLSSAEMNVENLNAEMTDFAILPEYRGNNYALFLLNRMEEELKMNGYKTLYTIARAHSYGMNITFSKLNYIYSGTLINNTNIYGRIESMNVWYKLIG